MPTRREVERWLAYFVTMACSFGAAYTEQYGFAFLIMAYATQQHINQRTPDAHGS